MQRFLLLCFVSLFAFAFLSGTAAQEIDADYKIQGEYAGTISVEGEDIKFGIQVIALGEGKFTAAGYMGGLPGDGWNGEPPERIENVASENGTVKFEGQEAVASIKDGVATILDFDGTELGEVKKVHRKSPTLGAKPPENARSLFDGSSVDGWHFKGKPARMTEDGLLMQGANSKALFQSHRLHIEFRTPYKPTARGQGRRNSGLYLQGRYEVQILDSFGLTGEQNECGGVYSIKQPDLNMCFPPMQWQTYDVEFHAAKFEDGKRTQNAWMTVKHNGVTIHDRVVLPKKTTAAPLNEGPEPGFIHLQDHGNPVRYRNIWVVEIDDEDEADNKDTTSIKNQTHEAFKLNDEVTIEYLLSLPKDYESAKSAPLLLFLHGAGERGDNLDLVAKHGPPKKAKSGEDSPFVVVSPQCKKGKRWDAEQLTALLNNIETNYKIDKRRIYVTGLSMGGYGTWNLAAHSPERFAAIIPICGGPSDQEVAKSIGDKVPVWAFHGAKDRVVPIERSQDLVNTLKELGVDVKFTIYPDAGHDSWTETYDNPKIYDWLLSHTTK